jgi:serine/threonine-protein kinase
MIPRERWTRLKPILEPAVDLSPGEASGYLERVCGDDPKLREEAGFLLRACEGARRSLLLLDSPAAELAAPLLELERLSLEPPEALEPGVTVGPYLIERCLGRGGMGVVYLAHDRRLDRRVALKLLPPGLAAADAAKRRFVQEAKAASRLDHPNPACRWGCTNGTTTPRHRRPGRILQGDSYRTLRPDPREASPFSRRTSRRSISA